MSRLPDSARLLRRLAVMARIALVLATTAACHGPGLTETAAQSEVASDAQAQRKRWDDLKIRRYDVTYLLIEGADSAAPAYRLVKVINNGVLDTTCPHSACPSLHLRDLRTIPDLFNLIIDNADMCAVSVTYHVERHYPSIVRADCARSGKPDFRVIVQSLSLES